MNRSSSPSRKRDVSTSACASQASASLKLSDSVKKRWSTTARFSQRGVHDFAWTASPDFVVVRDHFDPDTDVPREQTERMAELLGVPPEELRLQPVDIILLLQPSHRNQADRYIQSAKAAIRGYGLPLGAYPYATLTMVDPPRGGMAPTSV